MKKIIICVITDGYLYDDSMPVNGTQAQCFYLAREFARRNYDVHYLCRTQNADAVGVTQEYGFTIHRMMRTGNIILRDLQLARLYLELLKELDPDVVYNRGRSFLTYVAAQASRKSHAVFVWGSNGENGCEPSKLVPKLLGSSKALWKKVLLFPAALIEDKFIRKGIASADVVINQTNVQRQDYKRYFKGNGTVVKSASRVPDESVLDNKQKVVLWLATLSPAKQPEKFIELARKLEKHADWKFILAGGTGDAVYLEKIEAACKSLGNMEIAGEIPFDDTSAYFSRGSLFINTAGLENEGLPNTFIEAWSHGMPVVSLNHDPDGVIHNMDMGFFADGDFEAMLHGLEERMLDPDLLARQGKNARCYALETFAVGRIVDRYEELIGSAMDLSR